MKLHALRKAAIAVRSAKYFETLKTVLLIDLYPIGVPPSPHLVWSDMQSNSFLASYQQVTEQHVRPLGLVGHPTLKWLAACPCAVRDDGIIVAPCYKEQANVAVQRLQLLMEVCGSEEIHHVVLDSDDKILRSHKVARDSQYFARALPALHKAFRRSQRQTQTPLKSRKRKLFHNEEKQVQKKARTSEKTWSEIHFEVGASSIKSFMLQDALLDYLNSYFPSLKTSARRIFRNQLALSPGGAFEAYVFTRLKAYLGEEQYSTVCEGFQPTIKGYEATLQEIRARTPVLLHPVVYNPINQSFGVPDIVALGSIIVDCFHTTVPDEDLYYVVDAKCIAAEVESHSDTLVRKRVYQAYKGQLCLYTHALNCMQEGFATQAFIVAQKYVHSRHGVVHMCEDPFAQLARFDLLVEKQVVRETIQAIEWRRKFKYESHLWDIDIPGLLAGKGPADKSTTIRLLAAHCLLPNMKNLVDGPWRTVKEKLAENLRDITSLWLCGPQQRETAFAAGVYTYDDDKCNSGTLGLTGRRATVLDHMLIVNRNPELSVWCSERVADVWRVQLGWLRRRQHQSEYFVCICADPTNSTTVVGVASDSRCKTFQLKPLTSDSADSQDVYDYLREKTKGSQSRLFFWNDSGAPILQAISHKMASSVQTVDIYSLLQTYPIFVNGALDFNFTSYAKALYESKDILHYKAQGSDSPTAHVEAMCTTLREIVKCFRSKV